MVDFRHCKQKGAQLVGRLAESEAACSISPAIWRERARTPTISSRDLLARIDDFIDAHWFNGQCRMHPSALRRPRLRRPRFGSTRSRAGIRTVVWATGYRRSYAWLDVPALDEHGELTHEGGVTRFPGLYALGSRFMRRRKSNFIDGVGRDAEELADHIAGYLRLGRRLVA